MFISHYDNEIRELCSEATVLRDGEVAHRVQDMEDVTPADMSRWITGSELNVGTRERASESQDESAPGAPVLELRDLKGAGLGPVDLVVRGGEIVGLVGLLGSGARELARALGGHDKIRSGSKKVAGQDVRLRNPEEARKHGVGYLTNDRTEEGIIGPLSVRENIVLGQWPTRGGLTNREAESRIYDDYYDRLSLVTSGPGQEIARLSRGNQQKVMIARLLASDPKLLILDEPSFGVDVGVREDVHNMVTELAGQSGMAVVLLPSDPEELVRLADRVLIFRDGAIAAQLVGEDISIETILGARETEPKGEEAMSTGTRTSEKRGIRRILSSPSSLSAGRASEFLIDNIVWVLLVVFVIGASFINPIFASIANIQNILIQATVLGFLSLAVALTLLISEINLSIVGAATFGATVGAWLMSSHGAPTIVAIPATLVVGLVVGVINGIFVAKFRMTALIATLAMGLLLGGAVLAVTRGQTIGGFPPAFNYVGFGTIAGWPVMPFVLAFVYILAYVVLNRTPWGPQPVCGGRQPQCRFWSRHQREQGASSGVRGGRSSLRLRRIPPGLIPRGYQPYRRKQSAPLRRGGGPRRCLRSCLRVRVVGKALRHLGSRIIDPDNHALCSVGPYARVHRTLFLYPSLRRYYSWRRFTYDRIMIIFKRAKDIQ